MTNLHIAIGFGARFYDELMSGLPDVLMPTIQAQLGLSVTQVALLRQILDYVAAAIEPVNGLLIDLWQRKWLMGFGATMLGLALITMGLAPTFLLLLVGYVLFGLGSGPLAHTGDVVIVEAYPDVPDRAYARSTLIDTVGALLAPLLVTLFFWQGWSWRWLMVIVGLWGFGYASIILKNGLPNAPQSVSQGTSSTGSALWQNLRAVLTNSSARRWLLLFLFDLAELPLILKTVWLAQEVGMSQALIGVYVVMEMSVGLISLMVLDQWRRHGSVRRILTIITPLVLILQPIWLLTPGIGPRFWLMVPLTFFTAMFWPLLKGSSLASVPGRAGAVTAINSLFGLLPLALLFGLLAEQINITWAMLSVHLGAMLVMGSMVFTTSFD
ncbi:MAG: MFS transporter [Chloroflexota bacterium]